MKLLTEWPGGHKLYQDDYQWIVKHGARCRNAYRGKAHGYVSETFFRQVDALREELTHCVGKAVGHLPKSLQL